MKNAKTYAYGYKHARIILAKELGGGNEAKPIQYDQSKIDRNDVAPFALTYR